MDWFRRHHGAPLNPRWRLIARRSGQPVAFVIAVWDLMEDNASRATPRGTLVGWDDEAAAIALDMEPEAVQAIREAMQGKALNVDVVMDWEITQPKREREDDSKERVRAFRERQRQETPKKPKSRRVTPRNATQRPDREIEEKRGEETEEQQLPPPEGAHTAPDAGDNLVGWWIKREERKTGRRPPDGEIGKQSVAAKRICAERTTDEVRRAVRGMDRVYPYVNGTPWHLKDLETHFQTALTIPLTGAANGNGRNGNGKGWRGGDDWRRRGEGESARNDPIFADDDE